MRKPEIKSAVVIPLRFTTVDGQEVPIPGYAAVPVERLRKLEELALIAQNVAEGVKEAKANVGLSPRLGTAHDELIKGVLALKEIWDFRTS